MIQQGMSDGTGLARRYHWLSGDAECFVEEPHEGISAERREDEVLNLTSGLSDGTRDVSLDLVNDGPGHLESFFGPRGQRRLSSYAEDAPHLEMPRAHPVSLETFSRRTLRNLERACERAPRDYEELVSLQGVGKRSLRALALISELVYGTESDWRDPARYSFAHGGKDGTPYPIDRERYDSSIRELEEAIEGAEVGRRDRLRALERLSDVA